MTSCPIHNPPCLPTNPTVEPCQPNPASDELKSYLKAGGFDLEKMAPYLRATHPSSFQMYPDVVIQNAVFHLLYEKICAVARQLDKIDPNRHSVIIKNELPITDELHRRIMQSLFVFDGDMYDNVANCAVSMFEEKRLENQAAIASGSEQEWTVVRPSKRTSAPPAQASIVGKPLGLPFRFEEDLEIVKASCLEDVERVRALLGATVMHGSTLRNAKSVARAVSLTESETPSEFSAEPCFYCTDSEKAAVSRSWDKYRSPRIQRGIAFFNDALARNSTSVYQFTETDKERRLWRQLIHRSFKDSTYKIHDVDLMSADIVIGRICYNPGADDANLIRAYAADQISYHTTDAINFLKRGASKVVVEFNFNPTILPFDNTYTL